MRIVFIFAHDGEGPVGCFCGPSGTIWLVATPARLPFTIAFAAAAATPTASSMVAVAWSHVSVVLAKEVLRPSIIDPGNMVVSGSSVRGVIRAGA